MHIISGFLLYFIVLWCSIVIRLLILYFPLHLAVSADSPMRNRVPEVLPRLSYEIDK